MQGLRDIRPLPLAGLAAACLGAFVTIYLLLLRTHAGQRLDQRAMDPRAAATKPARYAIHTLLTTINVGMLVVVVATLMGLALMRRRPALALIAAATIGGATLLTEALKHSLYRPVFALGEPFGNTFPSGHTTVAFSVGVAAVLVAPPHLRRLVAAGAVLYAAAVGIAVVAAGWHRPSDVAGAFLVVIGWAALVSLLSAAYVPDIYEDPPDGAGEWAIAPRHLAVGALTLVVAYVVLLAALLVRRGGDIDWVLPGGTFLASSVAIALLAAILLPLLLLAVKRTPYRSSPVSA